MKMLSAEIVIPKGYYKLRANTLRQEGDYILHIFTGSRDKRTDFIKFVPVSIDHLRLNMKAGKSELVIRKIPQNDRI